MVVVLTKKYLCMVKQMKKILVFSKNTFVRLNRWKKILGVEVFVTVSTTWQHKS